MAAFSSSTSFQQHHPFLLDSIFLPTSPSIHTRNIMSPPLVLHQLPNQNQITTNDANSVVIHKNSMDSYSSIVTDKNDHSSDHQAPSTHQENNFTTPIHNKRKFCKQASSANSAQSKDKRGGRKKQKKITKLDEEKKNNSKEENKEAEAEAEAAGYIHVRARRGQATDSHSLAERVRRERISERMKLLQALVPGCDKVTGKALMLDEIINYVQSLQNQVEFLSMKLASVNPMFYDFGVDLESFMARPDQDLSDLPSPLPSIQECSPTTANNYNFLENNNANPILFQQHQLPNVLPHPQGSRQTLWEVDEHRQKIVNQSGFNNSLFSFH